MLSPAVARGKTATVAGAGLKQTVVCHGWLNKGEKQAKGIFTCMCLVDSVLTLRLTGPVCYSIMRPFPLSNPSLRTGLWLRDTRDSSDMHESGHPSKGRSWACVGTPISRKSTLSPLDIREEQGLHPSSAGWSMRPK